MSPTLRNIALAIALLGLIFWGYKQQLHLPKPSLNPFDDQWEMSMPWLKNNCDSIVPGYCGAFSYEVSNGSYRVGYLCDIGYKDVIYGKDLSVTADTVKFIGPEGRERFRSLDGKKLDSFYSARFNYTLLDSVCSTFGYSPISLFKPKRDWYRPRYVHSNNRDTIDFKLRTRHTQRGAKRGIRDFVHVRLREPWPFTN